MTRQRNPSERESHLAEISRLYLSGSTQQAIAAHLGLSQPTISLDLKELRKRWRASAIRDFDESITEELAKLNLLEAELWQQWERSKNAKITRRNEKADGSEKSTTIEQNSLGNPQYLSGVLACIDRRCKLLGLDAELKYQDLSVAIAKVIQRGFIVTEKEPGSDAVNDSAPSQDQS